LEISLAEEDLHRHRGNFDAAIATREQRLAMMASPLITCYEREADSDNRHAAALYDAHRFSAAIDCLTPWYEKLQVDPKICLPETRAKLFNTLARCFVASKDPNWESLFRDSLEIQFVSDPGNVPITENYLSHGLLAFNRFNEAKSILKFGSDESDPFRIWLAAECSRQAGEVWDESLCQKALSISESFHVHGFACQAIARQPGRTPDSKTRYFESARRSFEHGMEADVTNVKRMLGAYCSFAIAAVADDQSELSYAVRQFRRCTAGEGFKEIREWYMDELDSIERNRNWASIETLFQRVPHL
jgi:hypothetical protein